MSGFPPRHSFRFPAKAEKRFQGAEHRSSSLTLQSTPFIAVEANFGFITALSATSLKTLTSKPYSCFGPFIVELFTLPFLRDARTWSKSGSGCRQPRGSLRWHTLNEPFFRREKSRWSEPRGRISSLATASPTSQHDGLDETPRSVRIALIPRAKSKRHRIER